MRLIDAERIEDFAYEPEFGTKDVIEDWIEETNIPFDVKVEYEEELRKLCWKVIQGCMNITKTEPTAYDIEKVVAELKEWTFNADINLGDGTVKNSDLIASENAIEIVKRGIVSDNDVCEWKYNDEFEFAKSECGAIDTHRIAFRKLKFCPYCGKKIKVVE